MATLPNRGGGGLMGTSSMNSLPPFQLLFIIFIVLFLIFISWYMAYESAMEDTVDQLKLYLMISPLLLLLAVRCWSKTGIPTIPLPPSEPNAIHRAGSSPWGVGLLVILLLLMISYQSTFHDQWFPLWRRSQSLNIMSCEGRHLLFNQFMGWVHQLSTLQLALATHSALHVRLEYNNIRYGIHESQLFLGKFFHKRSKIKAFIWHYVLSFCPSITWVSNSVDIFEI